jgi:hypothetical protein
MSCFLDNILHILVLVLRRHCKKTTLSLLMGATQLQMSLDVIQYPLPTGPEGNQYSTLWRMSEGLAQCCGAGATRSRNFWLEPV